MKIFAAALLMIAAAASGLLAYGQVNNPSIVIVASAPSGSCTQNLPDQQVVGLGTIYTCQSGTWTSLGGGGGVTAVTGTAPVVSSGGATPVISMHVADGSDNGYLASADWSTFNGKQAALSLTAGTYADGDWCSYASSGTLLNCNNAAPQAALGWTVTGSGASQVVTAPGTLAVGATLNGLTLTKTADGFTVAGGTASKTLTVVANVNTGTVDGTLGSAAFTPSSAYLPANLVPVEWVSPYTSSLLMNPPNLATFCASAGATAFSVASVYRPMNLRIQSAATIGDCAGWSGTNTAYSVARQPLQKFAWNFNSAGDYTAGTSTVIWLGMYGTCTVATMIASGTPSACDIAAIRFLPGTDSVYQCVTASSAGSQTVTPIVGAMPTSGSTAFSSGSISFGASSASVTCTVNGLSATVSTNVPDTSIAMSDIFTNTAANNTIVYLFVNGVRGYSQNGEF